MLDNKAKVGSEPAKRTFGNTEDKPDNIRQDEQADENDPITSGAHQRNLNRGKDDEAKEKPQPQEEQDKP